MKRRQIALIQSALAVGLIVLIFYRMKNKSDLLHAVEAAVHRWPLLLLAVLIFGVCVCVVTHRWQYFLKRQGLTLTFGRAFLLYLIGHFFNSFFFGVTGGDVVKAYYAARETRHKKAEAIVTVFVDRAVGLVALVVLAVVMMLVRPGVFLSQTAMRVLFVFFAASLLVCAVIFVLVLRKDVPENGQFLRHPVVKTRLDALVHRGYEAFRLCLEPPSLMVKSFVLSLANHVVFVLAVYLLGTALEISLNFLDYLLIFPVISAVTALPLTPGGTGTREWTSRYLLGLLGVPETRAVSLSLLVYGVFLAWSLIGGATYLFYSFRAGRISSLELDDS